MKSITVCELVSKFLDKRLRIINPERPNDCVSFMERVWSICHYHQYDAIVKKIVDKRGNYDSQVGTLAKLHEKIDSAIVKDIAERLDSDCEDVICFGLMAFWGLPQKVDDIIFNKIVDRLDHDSARVVFLVICMIGI